MPTTPVVKAHTAKRTMVRRIRDCQGCRRRFISQANAPFCSTICSSKSPSSLSNLSFYHSLLSVSSSSPAAATAATPAAPAPASTTTSPSKLPWLSQSVNYLPPANKETSSLNHDPATEATDDFFENDEIDEFDNHEEAGSEGAEDLFCTQIEPHDHDDDKEEEEENEATITILNDTEPNVVAMTDNRKTENGTDSDDKDRPTTSTLTIHNSTRMSTTNTRGNNDICFICGSSLLGLKRRVDHIKRCSKKWGISGRDVRQDDEELLAVDAEETRKTSTATQATQMKGIVNPYSSPSKRKADWHGDATTLLSLSGTATAPPPKTEVQTSLLKTFQPKPRNALNVLLAGARKLSKEEGIYKKRTIAAARSQGVENGSERDQKRRGRNSGTGTNQGGRSTTCPTYKKIAGTDFVVDGFFYAKPVLTSNYFLTHFHSDHYGGITSSWNAGTIYCSLPTATLVHQQLGVDKKYLHPLPMMTPTVIETNKNKFNHKPVTVTLLDANHCPGAIMFLFEIPISASGSATKKRRILHVGDFRWNRDLMMQQTPLREIITSPDTVLDYLYLDTTYCNEKYSLPPQQDAIDAILGVFEKEHKRCKENPTRKTLHLFGSYTIGKEKMYLSVAERFGLRVYVDVSRYRVLSAMKWGKERMNVFTTCKEEACIWVVPLGNINMKKMGEYLDVANSKPFATPYNNICGYRPTGWSMSSKPSSSAGRNCLTSCQNGNLSIHSVPYSEHSSFPELVDCLRCLRPMTIIPTVSVSKSEEQVEKLIKGLRNKQTTLNFSP